MFNNLLRVVVTASALTLAHTQTLANGNYQIKSVSQANFARNLPGTQNPSPITFNDFTWHVTKNSGDAGFTMTNIGSGNTAAVIVQDVGNHVEGFNNMTTQFAIESAGNGNFAIKSPNADLLWAIFENGTSSLPFLEPANAGNAEKFQFIAV